MHQVKNTRQVHDIDLSGHKPKNDKSKEQKEQLTQTWQR